MLTVFRTGNHVAMHKQEIVVEYLSESRAPNRSGTLIASALGETKFSFLHHFFGHLAAFRLKTYALICH